MKQETASDRGTAYYYVSPSNDPYYNISLEDYLYQRLRHVDQIYMLWVNSPSVFMGRYQSARAETDHSYLQTHGIPILRRASGGGAVYHDLGNLCYSVIRNAPEGELHDLKTFPQPIISAMESQGVELELSPRGDLRYRGLKVAGSAETTRAGRMLYHLSILFDADLQELERVLAVPADEVERSRVASVRSKVCNLSPLMPEVGTMGDFVTLILEHIGRAHHSLHPLELDLDEANAYIEHIRRERYASDDWTYSSIGRRPH